MKILKKLLTMITLIAIVTSLTACTSFESKAKKSIDSYMKNMKSLTSENYVSWVNENLDNPYSSANLDLNDLYDEQINYFIKCLSKINYEIISVDETNRIAEVNVSYIDSTEYITTLIEQLLNYVFSEEYSEEAVNQVYLDVANSIQEDKFVNETVYFSFNEDASVLSCNCFDIATAGIYKIILGEPSNIEEQKYSKDELLENLQISYEILNDYKILVTITNNNEIPVNPVIDFIFYDKDGNYVIQTQANIDVLPAGETNYTYAYNELNEEVVSYTTEIQISYYEPEQITIFDNSLVPYEIIQGEEDEVDIVFTNNTDQTINVCGSFFVYDQNDKLIDVDTIYLSDIETSQSDNTWFYENSIYNEETDTWTIEPFGKVEVFPIAHTYAYSISVY